MIHSGRLIVALFLCHVAVATEVWGGVCDAASLEASIRKQLDDIRSYKLVAQISANKFKAVSDIQGRLPSRLRIEMKMTEPAGRDRWIHIYDGKHQWAEHHTEGGLMVYRIRLKLVASPERPFDSGYFLMGSGLLTGEDYPSTLRTLLTIYQMTGQCTPTGAMLHGVLDHEKLHHYINSKKHVQDPVRMAKRFAMEFPLATLRLKADPLIVKGYELGSQDRTNLSVTFDKVLLNAVIPPSRFDYTERSEVEVMDITDQIRDQ